MEGNESGKLDLEETIRAILSQMELVPDREIGGSFGPARLNARRAASYFLFLLSSNERLPRHAGKPSPGKIALAIEAREASTFNRQNFLTNSWCGKMLEAFEKWEATTRWTALPAAIEAAEAKLPQEKRLNELEREVLLLRGENQQLRRELAAFRDIIAGTGRMP